MTKRRKETLLILMALICIMSAYILIADSVHGATYTGKYWLKVNTNRNVVTAYAKTDGKWTAIRAMLCSTGLNYNADTRTPLGTFYTGGKWNWGGMMNDVYGQYCTPVTGDIMFHSVYYLKRYDKTSQVTSEFNRLGEKASHGCIRLCTMDAKWIYDSCKVGTRVTVYSSSKAGPLGKPAGIRVNTGRYTYWDPTDPDPSNPYFLLKKPIITVYSAKPKTVKYNGIYKLKNYVHAKDPNTFMKLDKYLKVSKVEKYSPAKKKYVSSPFTTASVGTYKITYAVNDPYSGKATARFKVKVVDNSKAPVIYGAKSQTVNRGDANAVRGVTAKQPSCSRTSSIMVNIKSPGSSKFKTYTYLKGSKFVFNTLGKYEIKYTVKNKYKPYKSTTRTVYFTCVEKGIEELPVLKVPDSYSKTINTTDAAENVSATYNMLDVSELVVVYIQAPGDSTYNTILSYNLAKSYVFDKAGEYNIKYSIMNTNPPYQEVSKNITITVT